MTLPIAIQLWTVREALANDFAGTIRAIAEIGYAGIEPAGFPSTTPQEAAKLFQSLGLQVPSAHTPMPIGDRKQEVLDTMAAIGSKRIVSGQGPDQFTTVDDIKRACERFNQASAVAVENGLTFGIHNHWWEFLPVDGRYPYQIMLEQLDPAVFFEIDTYWVQTAGLDATQIVKEIGSRAPLLHIKDGPCVRDEPMVAVGDGKMDFTAIMKASGSAAEWLIVELDSCATDMMQAVEKSYRYLVEKGFGHGTKS